jgi:hypothetical protein
MVWYQHEPDWKRVAEGRLARTMRRWSSTIENANNFGINFDVSFGISQNLAEVLNKFLKLDLSAQFARTTFRRTSWKTSAEFGDVK